MRHIKISDLRSPDDARVREEDKLRDLVKGSILVYQQSKIRGRGNSTWDFARNTDASIKENSFS
jgi:hypothetical protein